MSWIERVKSDYIITCGDGKSFKVLWKPLEKLAEFNISEFNFPDVSGTLVRRTTPRGRKYGLEIYFQGEDHIDQSNDFENSARDSRPWVISHPYYDAITVQPVSLTFDHSLYNTTKITGTVIETITEDNPRTSIDPVDFIAETKTATDEAFVTAFDVAPDVAQSNTVIANNEKIYRQTSMTINSEEYFNVFNTANTAMLNATSEPLAAMRAMQAFINAPALFNASVQNRIGALSTQFDVFRTTYLSAVDRSNKKLFELFAGSTVSSYALAASTPIEGDYTSKTNVLRVVDQILEIYNQYIEDLDSLQTDNGGELDSFIPDADSLINLNNLIDFTISNLFSIALGAKQERTLYLEDDSNIILVTHRLIGLVPDDSTINNLIDINDIGLNEMLHLRKGRSIIYYV